MMDFLTPQMYFGMTILLSFALLAHAVLVPLNGNTQAYVAWGLQLLGWAFIVLRLWMGLITGVAEISYSGAVGLIFLACGAILQSLRLR